MNIHDSIQRLACLGSAFMLLGLPVISHAQADIERLFIFGDSLSDSGNVWQLTGQTSKAPYALIPSAPYVIGGHHFSNGKTWAERLSQDLNSNSSGKPALAGPGKNGNYAFGGARARSNSPSQSPSSAIQIQMFLGEYGSAPTDALYVVQFGGNDLRDALVAGAPGTPAAQAEVFAIMQAAITETAGAIQTLYFAGARKFLVANTPNLEHAPAVIMSGAGAVAGFLAGIYNGSLEGALQGLELAFPDANIMRLNLAEFIDDVVADPAAFGISNTTTPCLIFMAESDAKCENAQEYLFWDGIHPTAAAHESLAAKAAVELPSVTLPVMLPMTYSIE